MLATDWEWTCPSETSTLPSTPACHSACLIRFLPCLYDPSRAPFYCWRIVLTLKCHDWHDRFLQPQESFVTLYLAQVPRIHFGQRQQIYCRRLALSSDLCEFFCKRILICQGRLQLILFCNNATCYDVQITACENHPCSVQCVRNMIVWHAHNHKKWSRRYSLCVGHCTWPCDDDDDDGDDDGADWRHCWHVWMKCALQDCWWSQNVCPSCMHAHICTVLTCGWLELLLLLCRKPTPLIFRTSLSYWLSCLTENHVWLIMQLNCCDFMLCDSLLLSCKQLTSVIDADQLLVIIWEKRWWW